MSASAADTDKIQLFLWQAVVANDCYETLNTIKNYLIRSKHSEKKTVRKSAGEELSPILSVYEQIVQNENSRDKGKSHNQPLRVGQSLDWKVIDKNSQLYRGDKPVCFKITKSGLSNPGKWEETFKTVCNELRGSKSGKKKEARAKLGSYAPGILYVIRAARDALKNPERAPDGAKHGGTLEDQGVIDKEPQKKAPGPSKMAGVSKVDEAQQSKSSNLQKAEQPNKMAGASKVDEAQQSKSSNLQKAEQPNKMAGASKVEQSQPSSTGSNQQKIEQPSKMDDTKEMEQTQTSGTAGENRNPGQMDRGSKIGQTPRFDSTDDNLHGEDKSGGKMKKKSKKSHRESLERSKSEKKSCKQENKENKNEQSDIDKKLDLEHREHKITYREKDVAKLEEKLETEKGELGHRTKAMEERERIIKEKEDKLKKDQDDLESRKKDVEGREKQITETEANLKKKDEELKSRTKDVDKKMSDLKAKSDKSSKKQPQEVEMKYNEEILKLKEALREQKEISEDLRQRLSKEMGDKVSSNESSVENISIKHRPMNINDDYGTFQSSEWLDAKTFLDEHLETSSTQDKIGLLSEMLQVTENVVTETWCSLVEGLEQILLSPVSFAVNVMGSETPNLPKRSKEAESLKSPRSMPSGRSKGAIGIDRRSTIAGHKVRQRKLPVAVKNAIGDFMRVEVDNCDFKSLTEATKIQIGKDCEKIKPWISCEPIDTYISCMVRLCWMMTIQRPPMTFDFTEKGFDEKYQELFWGSVNDADANVCVVFPLLKHGGRVMGKGKIYLYKESKTTIRL